MEKFCLHVVLYMGEVSCKTLRLTNEIILFNQTATAMRFFVFTHLLFRLGVDRDRVDEDHSSLAHHMLGRLIEPFMVISQLCCATDPVSE